MITCQQHTPSGPISLFVKSIWSYERSEDGPVIQLPFFADGYPGLIFYISEQGLRVRPHDQEMPPLFLYGQTISPVNLEFSGRFSFVLFQLYPLGLKSLFDLHPERLNDNCHHPTQLGNYEMNALATSLRLQAGTEQRIALISQVILDLIRQKEAEFDPLIKQSVDYIIKREGKVFISEIAQRFEVNIRSLERKFKSETGLTAKQFAKIIQFSSSLHSLNKMECEKMNQLVYDHGFSDQSHFIRVFKYFTGKTPRKFSR